MNYELPVNSNSTTAGNIPQEMIAQEVNHATLVTAESPRDTELPLATTWTVGEGFGQKDTTPEIKVHYKEDIDKIGDAVVAETSPSRETILSKEKLEAMTPAQSFALAGELVGKVHGEHFAKENALAQDEIDQTTAENTIEMEKINEELAREEALLVAKYGPKENWPENAKKVADTHKIGWGFATVAGVGALAGALGSTDADAGVLDIFGQRASQEIQYQTNQANRENDAVYRYETQKNQLELRITEGRNRMESNFERQASQKNLQYQSNRIKDPDSDWNNFVASVQRDRALFEKNAQLQRNQLDLNYNAQIRQAEITRENQARQADTNAIQRTINDALRGKLGR